MYSWLNILGEGQGMELNIKNLLSMEWQSQAYFNKICLLYFNFLSKRSISI